MIYNHNEYLNYELPNNWCAEENMDNLLLYNPDGDGAISTSFFNVLNTEKSLCEEVSLMATKFLDQNNIHLHSNLMLFIKGDKILLSGTGTTTDQWFMKLWIVAKYPRIVFATYFSEQKSTEVEICDSIIDSFQFAF